MKICVLAPEFLPVWGGVGSYVVELVRHLPKSYDIHVLAPMRECWSRRGFLIRMAGIPAMA